MNRRTLARRAQAGFTLIELMIVVAIIGILAAIAIPQYQAYVVKSQVSRVMGEAGSLKTSVDTCFLDGKTAVTTAAAETATTCDPKATGSSLLTGASQGPVALTGAVGVPQVTMNADGTASIIATFGNGAAPTLKAATAKTLTWARLATGAWSCTTTAEAKYAPAGCPGA